MYEQYSDNQAHQGQFLLGFCLPVISNYNSNSSEIESAIGQGDFIIMTQSCDLAQRNDGSVAASKVLIAKLNGLEMLKNKDKLKNLTKNEIVSAYLLPKDNSVVNHAKSYYVDFYSLYTVDYNVVIEYICQSESKSGLTSPQIEHFSHRFGEFFSRVGLEENIYDFESLHKEYLIEGIKVLKMKEDDGIISGDEKSQLKQKLNGLKPRDIEKYNEFMPRAK